MHYTIILRFSFCIRLIHFNLQPFKRFFSDAVTSIIFKWISIHASQFENFIIPEGCVCLQYFLTRSCLNDCRIPVLYNIIVMINTLKKWMILFIRYTFNSACFTKFKLRIFWGRKLFQSAYLKILLYTRLTTAHDKVPVFIITEKVAHGHNNYRPPSVKC